MWYSKKGRIGMCFDFNCQHNNTKPIEPFLYSLEQGWFSSVNQEHIVILKYAVKSVGGCILCHVRLCFKQDGMLTCMTVLAHFHVIMDLSL